MADATRRIGTRLTALVTAALSFAATAAAQTYYGSGGGTVSQVLNRYFLPQDAQIAGVSDLIFVVVIPFLLVMILLYVGLSRLRTFTDRQAQAISLLLSLFLIPSGGYRAVSTFLFGLFGLGNAAPSVGAGPIAIPFIGPIAESAGLAAIVTFFVLIIAAYFANGKLDATELIMAMLGSTFVWFLLRGNAIVALFGFLIFAYIGWKVFETGMASSSLAGYLVGVLGLLILLWAIQSLGFLPAQLQQYAAFISFLGIIVFLAVVLLIVAAVIILLDCIFDILPFPNPFCP